MTTLISFAKGATNFLVAKNGTIKLSQPFEELQGSKLELKLITPKPITRTYFETNPKRICLAVLPMVAVLDVGNTLFVSCFKIWRVKIHNLSLPPPNILLGAIFIPNPVGLVWQVLLWWPSWIFQCSYLSCLNSYRAQIWNFC